VPEVPNQACSARIKRRRSNKRSNATSSFIFSGFSAAGTTLFACVINQNFVINRPSEPLSAECQEFSGHEKHWKWNGKGSGLGTDPIAYQRS
jgi:hypothetical protein